MPLSMHELIVWFVALCEHPFTVPLVGLAWLLLVLSSFFSRGWGLHRVNVLKARWHLRRLKRRDPGQQIEYLRRVSPFVFEEIILTALKKRGYKVRRNKRYTGDNGIDGRCWIDGKFYFIQAKRYRGYISASDVKDFSALCHRKKAKGLFCHTGKTGKKSIEFLGQNIHMISGDRLIKMLLNQ